MNGKFIDITVSAGVSYVKEHHDTIESALSEADDVLYKAKESGRNNVNWLDHAIESVLNNVRNSTVLDLGVNYCAHPRLL